MKILVYGGSFPPMYAIHTVNIRIRLNNQFLILLNFGFYKKLGLLNVQIKLYPGKRHEILNEISRQEVYDDILSWLETRIQSQ